MKNMCRRDPSFVRLVEEIWGVIQVEAMLGQMFGSVKQDLMRLHRELEDERRQSIGMEPSSAGEISHVNNINVAGQRRDN